PSPTTVSAVKVNWRPPLTVLLTRLTAISFSIMPSSISSRSRLRSRPRFSRGSAIAVSLSGRECCGLAAYRCGLERWIASGGQKPRSAGHGRCRRVRQEGGAGTAAPPPGSELQATLAGGVGQRLHAAVVTVARAVEGDLLDPRGLGLLGDRAADLGGGLDVLGALEALAHVGLGGAGGGQDLRAVGAEHLGVDVLAGAQHRQARHAEFADAGAGGLGAAQAGGFLVHGSGLYWKRIGRRWPCPGAGPPALRLLGFLADDGFVGVLHALALVGLRRTESTDLGGDLAHQLLVGTGHDHLGLGGRGDGEALGGGEHPRVREAEREAQVLALDGGAVAHAHELELALEALRDAMDHVGHDRTDGAGDRDLG